MLKSIKDVLQEAATDEIIKAWEKAYTLLADIFIRVEEKMYETNKTQTGGWEGHREFTVKKTEFNNKKQDALSLYLYPSDGKEIPLFKPG